MSADTDLAFTEELQKDFLEETTFLLDQCEESYLKLDAEDSRAEELGKIFRLAHSMKGAGACVGFLDLSGFAHIVEDCLSMLRVHTELVSPEVITLLLKAGDAFKVRVKMLKEKSAAAWDISALSAEVKAMTEQLIAQINASSPVPVMATGKSQLAETPPAVKASAIEIPLAERANPGPSSNRPQSGSVKVDTDRIDAVLDCVGELVVLKSQLMNETQEYSHNLKLNALVSLMEKSIRDLQDKALGMRMTPLKSLFLKTQRIVRDLSVKLGKPVEFEMIGEDTEIDRTMVELLSDPLMHIARNALDHGIEKAESRAEKGKNARGSIRLSAQQQGGRIVVKITDDGAGIDRQRIFNKALEKGLVPSGTNIDSVEQQRIYQFIFAPGFSTAEFVSDVSGRGVGMDVVKTNIEKLRGTVEIETHPGRGTSFVISIPLTTSITDGMQVVSSGQHYILPLDGISELVDFKSEATTEMHTGGEVLNVRGKLMPLFDLERILGGVSDSPPIYASGLADDQNTTIVVVESAKGPRALRVGAVIGQVQVVLKTLGDYFPASRGIAGAAILGDGKVALVLDIDNLKMETEKSA